MSGSGSGTPVGPFTIQNVCDLARSQMNDDAKARATDSKLEFWANSCLSAMALIRPDLFIVQGAITPVANQAQQDLFVADYNVLTLANIIQVVGGNAILQCDLRALLAAVPGALSQTAGVPVNWARAPGDEDGTRYFLYPRPATGTQILVQYTRATDYLALADSVPLSMAYRPVMASYIKYCYESVDDDYVIQQRATQELATFMGLLKAGEEVQPVKATQ